MKIAILGASGHIGKSLSNSLCKKELFLFSRTPGFLQYNNFDKYKYDLIINCIGIGTVSNIIDYSQYFLINEKYDNLIINYLKTNPQSLYINFSSGVVADFEGEIEQENYFAISKLYTEAKHRSLKHLNIIDLRLYSFFSQFINLKDDYFLNQIIKHIKENKKLIVNKENILRDYIHPEDLTEFINQLKPGNKVVTVGSKQPIWKDEILEYFRKNHGLRYKVDPILEIPSATGKKIVYTPMSINLDNIPRFTSFETIAVESSKIFHKL